MKKSLKFKKKFCNVGFTLVELVIVIAIVIVLSVASVPIYRGYVVKAIKVEGYALLGTILSAQKAYYSEHGNFLYWRQSSSSEEPWNSGNLAYTYKEKVLGIDARGNKYYTIFKVGDELANNNDPKSCFACVAMGNKSVRNQNKDGMAALQLNYEIGKEPTYTEWWSNV